MVDDASSGDKGESGGVDAKMEKEDSGRAEEGGMESAESGGGMSVRNVYWIG